MDNNANSTQTPIKCANGCGFYGHPSTMNLCSKCFRTKQLQEKKGLTDSKVTPVEAKKEEPKPIVIPKPAAPPSVATDKPKDESPVAPTTDATPTTSVPPDAAGQDDPKAQKDTTRCWSCNKKVGLLGFKCKCNYVFCSRHRYNDKHDCTYDYKGAARTVLLKENPVVIASKVDKL